VPHLRDHAGLRERPPDAPKRSPAAVGAAGGADREDGVVLTRDKYHGPLLTPSTNLPAAVIDPLTAQPGVLDKAARVIPEDAQRVTVGASQLGYWLDKRRKPKWRLGPHRVREVERLIELRHGGPCDTDDGEVYFIIVANALAPGLVTGNAGRQNPISIARARLARWAAEWTPRIPAAKIDHVIDRAVSEQRWWRQDTAANHLKLTMAERTAGRITTIGAIDCTKEQREEFRKQRKRDAQKARDEAARRADGAKTRTEYETQSKAAEARREGISRSTYYRRLKPKRDRLSGLHKSPEDSNVGQTTCVTPQHDPSKAAARKSARSALAPLGRGSEPPTPGARKISKVRSAGAGS
jgi:hypothetical protein